MLRAIYEAMPPRARMAAKRLVAAAGHKASFLDPLRGRHHAKTKKRFSAVSARLADQFRLAGIDALDGKCCMEFGAGYVPTELVYYWTLGASRLIATDLNRIAQFQFMPLALEDAPEAVRRFRAEQIEYIAPFDITRRSIPGFDFIHSESVLEHVPPLLVHDVLQNLVACLTPGGIMVHSIDLRDHLDLCNDPLRFLLDGGFHARHPVDPDTRGNMLRKSEWEMIFGKRPEIETKCFPTMVIEGPPIKGYSQEDVNTLGVLIVSKKHTASY